MQAPTEGTVVGVGVEVSLVEVDVVDVEVSLVEEDVDEELLRVELELVVG